MKLDQDGVEQMPRKIFSVTRENYTIYADASLMNKDIVVTLSGGNIPHLGGVVTYDYKTKKVEKIYFDSHDGRKHKDIFLAERFTEKIVSKLPGLSAIPLKKTFISPLVPILASIHRQIKAAIVYILKDWMRSIIMATARQLVYH